MDKTINNIFGICSLIGLIITVGALTTTLHQIEIISGNDAAYKSLAEIYRNLGITIIALITIFLIQSFLYNKKISELEAKLGELPLQNKNLTQEANHYIRLHNIVTKSLHNITHYYRYNQIALQEDISVLAKYKNGISIDRCRKTSSEFEKYMLFLLSNITSTVNIITKDECSACIKIMKKNKVKTLYRDPNSCRERRKSDYTDDGNIFIYDVKDNYAFKIITDSNSKETFFCCDNLIDHERYENKNREWNRLYNATIVVPIQARNKEKNDINVLGFLCCDNMSGGFESKELKDYISSIGDLLYNIVHMYDIYVQLANNTGLTNEKLQRYDYWIDSQ